MFIGWARSLGKVMRLLPQVGMSRGVRRTIIFPGAKRYSNCSLEAELGFKVGCDSVNCALATVLHCLPKLVNLLSNCSFKISSSFFPPLGVGAAVE